MRTLSTGSEGQFQSDGPTDALSEAELDNRPSEYRHLVQLAFIDR